MYKELKSRLNKRGVSARNYSNPNTNTAPPTYQQSNITNPAAVETIHGISFASALKTGLQAPALVATTPHPPHVEHMLPNAQTQLQPSGIEAILISLQQSMRDFMAFMQTTMQNLIQNQNVLMQLLASSKTT